VHITTANEYTGIIKAFGWAAKNGILHHSRNFHGFYVGKWNDHVKAGVGGKRYIKWADVVAWGQKVQDSLSHECYLKNL
jgi:hypothetical protein